MPSLIFSKKLFNLPHLKTFLLGEELCLYRFWQKSSVDRVLGWGLRPSTHKARDYAKKCNLPFVALEDGFLRSIGLGVEGYPPFSLVVDEVGIYYDTTCPSRLEQLILAADYDEALLSQASQAMKQIVAYQLSKYNHAPDFSETPSEDRNIVLVIDQTFGDMAVKYGQADEADFTHMLNTAIAENPHAEIWVKTHPDVISGKKRGYLTQSDHFHGTIRLLAQDCNPLSLLAVAEKVYCVTSQMGFEALLLGKQVVTFGVPWFAGWGVTDDRHPAVAELQANQRRKPRTFLQLFASAYLQYSRYINPNTGAQGSIFEVIDYLYRVRQFGERVRGTLYCVGMSLWKRAVIKPFFRLPQCQLKFISLRHLQKIQKNQSLVGDAKLLIWGSGKTQLLEFAKHAQLPILRMEDGFIRSVGLGSNLVAPLSLVVDDMGIYFNPQSPSRLEWILQHQIFSPTDLLKAEQLRQQLIENHIGKYNVGEQAVELARKSAKMILVPGQVEDDASIRLGSPKIQRNLDLLRTVREQNPEAYILYKPHPDVVSGNRVGHIPTKVVLQYADQEITHANILDCINQVDEVHTMTSLAGFEALLRGKIVHCYGLPFYSNWGLTVDHLTLDRRNRTLTHLELIAGVLIYYPIYISPEHQRFIDTGTTIQILKQQKEQLLHLGFYRSWHAKQFGKLVQLYKALY